MVSYKQVKLPASARGAYLSGCRLLRQLGETLIGERSMPTFCPRRLVTSFMAICLLASVAAGQQQGQDNREDIRTTASIKGMKGPYLYCINDEGVEMVVKLPDRNQGVTYTGQAHPNWLRPGMLVSLSAKLDKRGKASSPVKDIAVISPSEDTKIGAYPDVTAAGATLFSNESAEKRAAKPVAYSITGKITGMRNGKMRVQAGRVGLEFEVADDASVRVQVGDFRLTQVDDTAVIQGWHYKGKPQQVQARSISIESSKVLGEPQKKPAAAAGKDAPFEKDASEDDDK